MQPRKKLGTKFYIAFFILTLVLWVGLRLALIALKYESGFLPLFLTYLITFSVSYFIAYRFFAE